MPVPRRARPRFHRDLKAGIAVAGVLPGREEAVTIAGDAVAWPRVCLSDAHLRWNGKFRRRRIHVDAVLGGGGEHAGDRLPRIERGPRLAFDIRVPGLGLEAIKARGGAEDENPTVTRPEAAKRMCGSGANCRERAR